MIMRFADKLVFLFLITSILIIYSFSLKTTEPRFQRIECYKFKENLCAKGIEKHFKEFEALRKSISYIKSYSAGASLSGAFEKKCKL
jgi:hypothetical protein